MATEFSGVVIVQVKGVTVVMVHMRSVLEDTDIQRIAETLYELVDEKATRKLIVDFQAVNSMASQMLSVLLTLNGKMQAIDGKMVICGLCAGLMKLFKITGIDSLFTFVPNEAEGIRRFQTVPV